jgi:hypothetical protein
MERLLDEVEPDEPGEIAQLDWMLPPLSTRHHDKKRQRDATPHRIGR